MNVVRKQQGPVAVVSIRGPIVVEELEPLDRVMNECQESGVHKIVLELKEVPFIDSAGLELIQTIVNDNGKVGGEICVASLNDVCRNIFRVTRMYNFVQVAEDHDNAVRMLL